MIVNGADYWIEKDNADTYSFKTPGPELESVTYTLEKGEYWMWSNDKNPLKLNWSKQKYNPYKINAFPAATYAYVSSDVKYEVPTEFFTDLKVLVEGNDTSAVKETKETFLEPVKEYLTKTAADLKTAPSPIKLSSSQKALDTNNPQTEPKFTSFINGKKYTEDYIFNTGELKPVGSLDFPVFAGTLPASDYPSDHLSIMTQYRFA
jgi:hypothetical protein